MNKTILTFILLSFIAIPCFSGNDSELRKTIKSNIFKTTKSYGDKIGISAASKKVDNKLTIHIKNRNIEKKITCNNVENFKLISRSKKHNGKLYAGSLNIGLCHNKDINLSTIKEIEESARDIEIFDKLSSDKKKELGLYIKKENLNNGSTMLYYPMVAVGPGVEIIKAFIFFPSDRRYALVIQFIPDKMCDEITNPICNANHNGIKDIAIGLMQSLNNS